MTIVMQHHADTLLSAYHRDNRCHVSGPVGQEHYFEVGINHGFHRYHGSQMPMEVSIPGFGNGILLTVSKLIRVSKIPNDEDMFQGNVIVQWSNYLGDFCFPSTFTFSRHQLRMFRASAELLVTPGSHATLYSIDSEFDLTLTNVHKLGIRLIASGAMGAHENDFAAAANRLDCTGFLAALRYSFEVTESIPKQLVASLNTLLAVESQEVLE